MRHHYFGKQLSRTKNERKQLFRNLVRSLFLHGKIETTIAKAKSVQALAEKCITKAKIGSEQKKRELYAFLPDKLVINRILDQAKTRFGNRTSGYTRIIKLGARLGDSAEKVQLSFVDDEIQVDVIKPEKTEHKTKLVKASKEKPVIKKPVKKAGRGRPKKIV